MSSPSPLMVWAGRVADEAAWFRRLLPTYLHILASALFLVYIAAHASLSIPSSAAPPSRKRRDAHDDESMDEEPEVVAESKEALKPKDAILFPLLAGLTLSSLYFIIKWLDDPSTLNKILSYYYLQIGAVCGTKFFKDSFVVVRSFLLPNQYEELGRLWRINRSKHRYDLVGDKSDSEQAYRKSPLPGRLHRLPIPTKVADRVWKFRSLLYAKCSLNFHIHKLSSIKVPVDILDALAISTSLAVVGFFTFLYKPWYISNLIGFTFCYSSMQYMSPTTFWTGTLVQSALFFYDIYFVFFTPMMMTVATKVDIPIKLLFPRPAFSEGAIGGLSILGLGDIMIPGMMIAHALRFDLYLHYLKQSKTVEGKLEKAIYLPVSGAWGERFWVGRSVAGPDLRAKAFPKTYFKAGLVGYSVSLIVTLLVMQILACGQPALLYLVPGVLSALWGTAAMKGELDQMWNYTEDEEAAKPNRPPNQKKETSRQSAEEENEAVNSLGSSKNIAARLKSTVAGAENEELATTSIPNEDTDKPPELEGDSEAYSELDSNSESDTSFATPSSSHTEKTEQKTSALGKKSKDKEQECRHLIWFSIDFPPSPPAFDVEEEALTRSDAGAQALAASSSDGAET
ncbi:hypothetical protein GJ744_009193 [Endocarpon pusillum]|uniref:Signal peptide peptidase n=1 Tax=Endocarpon pusillum TaxID=364733 RepID=A0A8H7E4P7_9EURO|nr:hypothetical protein GJ744_009193 [Endocarpon pusillum]